MPSYGLLNFKVQNVIFHDLTVLFLFFGFIKHTKKVIWFFILFEKIKLIWDWFFVAGRGKHWLLCESIFCMKWKGRLKRRLKNLYKRRI